MQDGYSSWKNSHSNSATERGPAMPTPTHCLVTPASASLSAQPVIQNCSSKSCQHVLRALWRHLKPNRQLEEVATD